MTRPEPVREGGFDVVEATIAQVRAALEQGQTTSRQLVRQYLDRIREFDSSGPRLNSVVVFSPSAEAEATASDDRRMAGRTLGPLDGIPYTAKNSYMVKGMTVAAGSPAFKDLTAQWDAFVIERLRAGGAICLGLTNMPPMANGGMQRGLYGRAESPYSAHYLTAAYGSGSSNGSGTATAASFATFGLGEETWSSGRAPASNNALFAYTPSRGVISVRGNWPLVPTMDVVVPHTRTPARWPICSRCSTSLWPTTRSPAGTSGGSSRGFLCRRPPALGQPRIASCPSRPRTPLRPARAANRGAQDVHQL